MSKESITEKIKKLLRLAEKTTFSEEAAAAVGKAHALMLEHRITQMMLDEKNEEEETKGFSDPLFKSGRSATWRYRLAELLCDINGCDVYSFGGNLMMVGKPSNAENARYLFDFCVTAIDRITLSTCKGEGKAYNNNFRLGCVAGIKLAIEEEQQLMKNRFANKELIVLDKALSVISQDKALAIKFGKENLKLRSYKLNVSSFDGDAREKGIKAGKALYPGQYRKIA